jgi:hypothetical protein
LIRNREEREFCSDAADGVGTPRETEMACPPSDLQDTFVDRRVMSICCPENEVSDGQIQAISGGEVLWDKLQEVPRDM